MSRKIFTNDCLSELSSRTPTNDCLSELSLGTPTNDCVNEPSMSIPPEEFKVKSFSYLSDMMVFATKEDPLDNLPYVGDGVRRYGANKHLSDLQVMVMHITNEIRIRLTIACVQLLQSC